MTEVAFHVNVPDPLAYACRLLRKAWRGGARVAVVAPAPLLEALDAALWTFSAQDFVAHCRDGAAEHVLAVSPIVLLEDACRSPHHEVLVNMGEALAQGFERFGRVIELSGTQAAQVQAARARWKHYASRGYEMSHLDVGAGVAAN